MVYLSADALHSLERLKATYSLTLNGVHEPLTFLKKYSVSIILSTCEYGSANPEVTYWGNSDITLEEIISNLQPGDCSEESNFDVVCVSQ